MKALAYALSGLSLLWCGMFFARSPKPPKGFVVAALKLVCAALSPYLAIMGIAGAAIGWIAGAYWAIPIGLVGASLMIFYVWRCSRNHGGLEDAFGADWADQILPQRAKFMARRRWTWFLRMKASPEPSWERDVVFWTIPETNRELLCDIWRPANGETSGLTLIYFHGGAWSLMDKDFGTRPLFRHLVAQGHTVMDVAYRLCPEVDIHGMMKDTKRAVAWMKANASHYGVDPERIVLGGASAGGHLALLAAYAPQHPELTPGDLQDADLAVCGVVSYYGPTDLMMGYEAYGVGELATQPSAVPIGTRVDPKDAPNYAGRLDILLGGHPDEVPDKYRLACPTIHVHPGSPPTLLMQGAQDFLVPVEGTRELYARLVESGVPAISIVYPWTDHAFDLLLPQINPAAQSALYDLDRFLALLLSTS